MNKEKIRIPTLVMIEEEQVKLLSEITCGRYESPTGLDGLDMFGKKEDKDTNGRQIFYDAFSTSDIRKIALFKFVSDALVNHEIVRAEPMNKKDGTGDEIYSVRIRGFFGDLSYEMSLTPDQEAILKGFCLVRKIHFAELYSKYIEGNQA